MDENFDRLANIESQSCDRFCVIPWQTGTLLKRRPNSGLEVCRVFRPAVGRDRTEIRYVRTKEVTLRLQSPRIIERTEGLEKLTMCARSVALFQGVEPIIAGLCIDREHSVPMVIGKSSATRIISPLNSSEVPYFPRSDVSFFLRLPSSIFPSLLPPYSLDADFLIASSLFFPRGFGRTTGKSARLLCRFSVYMAFSTDCLAASRISMEFRCDQSDFSRLSE